MTASAPSSISDIENPPWHALTPEQVGHRLDSPQDGLSAAEVVRRRAVYGPNRLSEIGGHGLLVRLAAQFHNLLIYVLVAAAAVSVALDHMIDAAVILGVVVINAAVGFIQEGRAGRALDAIRDMIAPVASVLRDGERVTVLAEQVVPGDMVLIEAGDRVPADLRLVRARGLRIEEAALTGESVPVDKITERVPVEASLGDRTGMAYSGTLVVSGQGAGVAVATGAKTEIGRVTTLVGGVKTVTTPLLRQMNRLARQLTVVILGAAALVFAFAVQLRDYTVDEAFMATVGLAVAAIPEGLPAVITITLAIGVQRMAGRRAIIRRLPAVETLGSVSTICSDKTGTLTRNEMMARAVVISDMHYEVTGSGYEPGGAFCHQGAEIDHAMHPALAAFARGALLCSDARLREDAGHWRVDGDPMEGALVVLALKAGLNQNDRTRLCRRDVIPFDAQTRRMATLNDDGEGGAIAYVKGAPEEVIARCTTELSHGGERPLEMQRWMDDVERLARDGMRVLALAQRRMLPQTRELDFDDIAGKLVLLGLVGMIDPPREEAIAAVQECRSAGIRVKMITGDHGATASAIGRQLGLDDHDAVIVGSELAQLSGPAFHDKVEQSAVFARVSPEQKLHIVTALQSGDAVVAMTGDGVNDAPALKRANIGIAMGVKGTEAAKEAAEMVLADDNFATIVAAVEEGRTVYNNLKKVIGWTLPTNGGEAMAIMAAILFGFTLPVTPVQILWINMVTAVTLGLALAFEPSEPGVMHRPPRPVGQALLSGFLLWRVFLVSVLFVAGCFGIFTWALGRGLDVETARTMVVNTLVAMEIAYLFNVRFLGGPSSTWRGVLGTRAVLLAVSAVTAAQFAVTYIPAMQTVFGTRALGLGEGLAVAAVGVVLFVLVEIEKWLLQRAGWAEGR